MDKVDGRLSMQIHHFIPLRAVDKKEKMEKQDASAEVADIGVFLFQHEIRYHESFQLGMETILDKIKHSIGQTKLGQNTDSKGFWVSKEQALRIFLDEYDNEELDRILTFYFGIYPKEVQGDSRAFFENLYTVIHDGLEEARRRNSQEPDA